MPEFLANGLPVATQDTFVDALSLGPAAGVRSVFFSVLGSNAVQAQCYRYTDPQRTKWVLEPFTRVFAGQSIGIILKQCAGLRLASATAGKSSLVVAELDFDSDIDVEGGSITSATLDGSGNIIGGGLSGSEIGYVELDSTIDILGSDAASATTILDLGSLSYAAVATMLDFYAPLVTTDNSAAGDLVVFVLYDGATLVGYLGALQTPAAGSLGVPVRLGLRLTPTAASHDYSVAAYATNRNGGPAVHASALGGFPGPAFLRATVA